MRQLRKRVNLGDGAEVDLLFTPHLYSYKGRTGITLEYDPGDNAALLEVYADLMYLAAVNAWELDGKGTLEDVPFRRSDFHEWMMQDPAGFGRTVDFTVEALTGKPLKEYAKEGAQADPEAEAGKKKRSGWITRWWRRSSSDGADAPSGRRR